MTERGNVQEFEQLLSEYDIALLTTRGSDGHYHSRPMAMHSRRRSSREVWFVSSGDTQKIHDLEEDPHCALTMFRGGMSGEYISVSGTAEVVHDRQKVVDLWDPAWRRWVPEGPDAEDVVLIRFVPEHAEYLHPDSAGLRVLFSQVRSLVTNAPIDTGEKRELDLQ